MSSERKFLLLHGAGKNGKSVLLGLLRHVMGPYCGTMAPGLLMARENDAHPAEVADLFGLRLAIASEVKQGRAWDEEQVKRLTGGTDELKARNMRENWWGFMPTHKLMIALNDMPRVRDVTPAFWDRAILIPFTVRISDKKEDKGLAKKLIATESSGMLAWMLQGCMDWQEEGLPRPEAIAEATDDYRENEDFVGRFIKERLQFGHGIAILDKGGVRREMRFEMSTEDLNRALDSWLKRNKIKRQVDDREVGPRLVAGGAERCRWIDGKNIRGFKGVRIKDLKEDQTSTTSTTSTTSPLSNTGRVVRDNVAHLPQVTTVTKNPPIGRQPGNGVSAGSSGSRFRQPEKVTGVKKRILRGSERQSTMEGSDRGPVRPPRGSRPRGRGRKKVS